MYRFLLIVISVLGSSAIFAGNINPPVNISTSLYKEYDPSISPGGRYLVYCEESGGDENIYLLDLEKRGKRQITSHTASDYSPRFMGESKILFVSRRGNSLGDIYISDLRGEKIDMIIGGSGYYDTPVSAKDEKKIAYVHSAKDDRVFINIYIPKSRENIMGPEGILPSFFLSGDSLIYISLVDDNNTNRLAVYSLLDSSVSYLDSPEGLNLNPVVLNDGHSVLYENKSRDSDDDGLLTIKDESDLIIYDIDTGKSKRFLPGFVFTEPTLSYNNILCARGADGDFYRLPIDGLSEKESDFNTQIALCDSLIRYALNGTDSLLAAAVCYESYHYYPEHCRDLIIRSALIFSGLNRFGLALDIISEIESSGDSVFISEGSLAEAKIRYRMGRLTNNIREKKRAIEICENLIAAEGLPEKIRQEAYRYCIEFYFQEAAYETGGALIERAVEEFESDKEFSAILERWKLKYLSRTYAGDTRDLIKLYIELMDKYNLYIGIDRLLVDDLLEFVISGDYQEALDALEDLKRNYEEYPLLAGLASLEQARILNRQKLKSLAEWRLTEIIENYREDPELRFNVFLELFNLYLEQKEFDRAASMIDSISTYMDFINNYALVESFKIRAAEYYAFQGFRDLESKTAEARSSFLNSLRYDSGNYNALWGLIKAGFRQEDGHHADISKILSVEKYAYLMALEELAEYLKSDKISKLEGARSGFLKVIEDHPSYPIPYLSAGYVDCLLETNSKIPLGFYEEAVEYSLKGFSLAAGDKNLENAFYINLGEAFYGLGQFPEAFKYYTMVKDNTPAYNDSSGFLVKYGECAFHIDSLDIAADYFGRIFRRSLKSGDERSKALSAVKLGLISQTRGDYIEAADYFEIAKSYYRAENEFNSIGDLLKAQAFCLKMTGDNHEAASYASEAMNMFKKKEYDGAKYDYHVKFVWWPFGIKIPLIELLPMRFGGSLYPEGFTTAANEVFLRGLSSEKQDISSKISLRNTQIGMLEKAGEEENSVDLWEKLGAGYYEIGYRDSSAVAFRKAYKLSMNLEDYHGAYVELSNWAEVILNRPFDQQANTNSLKEIQDRSLDLYDYILPSYPDARANLKNIAGLAEFMTGLVGLTDFSMENISDLSSFLSSLDKISDRANGHFQQAKNYFREALTELVPGERPEMETGLLLNDALVSYSMGDFEGAKMSIDNAKRTALFSESAGLYAVVSGFGALNIMEDRGQGINTLKSAVGIFENMPMDKGYIVNIPFITMMYERIIDYYIGEEDYYTGLYYSEVMKKIRLTAYLNRMSDVLYKSDYFRANMSLLRDYQREILALESEKRKIEASRATSQLRLSNLNEKILQKRGRLLELREETRQIDPLAYSSLVPDVPSIKTIIGRIPKNEKCLVSYEKDGQTVFWICGRDSVEFHGPLDLNSRDDLQFLQQVPDNSIVTIASSDRIYELSRSYFETWKPGVMIKRAPSLDDAYRDEIIELRRTEGILIVRFDGYTLTDSLTRELGADVVYFNGTFPDSGIFGYGWIVLDGELKVDPNNFLLSRWENARESPGERTGQISSIYNLPALKNEAFGAFIIDGAVTLRGEQVDILAKLIQNSGIPVTVYAGGIKEAAQLAKELGSFFEGLRDKSPLKSYHDSFYAGERNSSGRDGIEVTYCGEEGWSRSEESQRAENLYNECLLIGNQYYIMRNWRMAQRNYDLALEIQSKSKMGQLSSAYVVRRLLNLYENMGEYNRLLQIKIPTLIEFLKEDGDSVYLTRIYKDMAGIKYDEYDLDESIKYSTALIDIAAGSNDTAALAEGCLIRGKSYLNRGELDKAAADLTEARRLYSSIEKEQEVQSAMLYFMEVLNLKGSYAGLKIMLDSLDHELNKENGGDNYSGFLIQLAKYYMATFRNELAKGHLQNALSINRTDARAKLLLGKVFLLQGDPDSALIYAREGLSSIRRKNEKLLLKDAHELLGDIYRLTGQYGEAVTQYNLAYDIIKDYRYGEVVDLIRYKQALITEADSNAKDSLYTQISFETDSRFVKDLCIYQLASNSLKRKIGSNAELYFGDIVKSDDNNSRKYLKWRAAYNLGLMRGIDNGLMYLKQAEEICGNYPVEPDYISSYYGLNEERADLFFMIADMYSRRGDLTMAANYLETAFSKRVSGRHFSVGCFDFTENEILDSIFASPPNSVLSKDEEGLAAGIDRDFRYRVLWGTEADSVEAFQSTLDVNESALRFYRVDSSYMAVYLASDSIEIIKYGFNGNDLRETLNIIGDLMANQSRADSVLEKWYTAILGPFESLLLTKEKIDLIPDGILHLIPLEALKMPQGDYLSEMFTVERRISLMRMRESPEGIGEGVPIRPIFTASYNPDIRYAQYMVEPFSRPHDSPEYGVRFYAGGFSFFLDSTQDQAGLVCAVRTFKEKDLSNFVLQAFLSLRGGNDCFAYPIWDVSDEIKSTYYWNLVKNLSEGAGYWKSWNNSRSYLFGHFEGLPYYWGANVYLSLN